MTDGSRRSGVVRERTMGLGQFRIRELLEEDWTEVLRGGKAEYFYVCALEVGTKYHERTPPSS
jgi:hypothetical protein